MRRSAARRGRREREERALAAGLRAALLAADATGLVRILGREVRVAVDSGGRVPGTDRVAVGGVDALPLLVCALGAPGGLSLEPVTVNGRHGLAARRCGEVIAVIGVRGAPGRARDVWVVANPEKLIHWNAH